MSYYSVSGAHSPSRHFGQHTESGSWNWFSLHVSTHRALNNPTKIAWNYESNVVYNSEITSESGIRNSSRKWKPKTIFAECRKQEQNPCQSFQSEKIIYMLGNGFTLSCCLH